MAPFAQRALQAIETGGGPLWLFVLVTLGIVGLWLTMPKAF